MIIDKEPLPGDEVEIQDAPPSYDALEGVPPPPLPRDEKGDSSGQAPTSLSSPTSPKAPSAFAGKLGGKRSTAWFNFGPSARAIKEVRATILGLLRDLVKRNDAHGALGVLESCSDACKTYDLSLSSLLQEHSIEGHTPLYWAIINRPPQDGPDLVSALLSHAAPLSDATVEELRLACLHTSDHALFQRLRRSPAFSPLSGTEEIILGGSVPIDDVDVEDVPGDEGAFVAKFRVPMFQKRMRISQTVKLEFIAKGRLWELSFLVAADHDKRLGYKHLRTGSWVVKLSLLPHSPPTWIDSRLVIEDPRARGQRAASQSQLSSGPPLSLFEAVMSREESLPSSPRPKPKPPVQLRLKAREQLTAPQPSSWSSGSWNAGMVVLSLEENAFANSLQFNGCPYLESDGSLVARLDARLAPPETECVIC